MGFGQDKGGEDDSEGLQFQYWILWILSQVYDSEHCSRSGEVSLDLLWVLTVTKVLYVEYKNLILVLGQVKGSVF